MASIADIGNGAGYIYITDASGNMVSSLPNTAESVKKAVLKGLEGKSMVSGHTAFGVIEVTVAPTGSGSISAVNVNGVTQIASSISYTVADTTISIASKIVSAINSYTPTSGYNYTATQGGSKVYIIAPEELGSGTNGLVVSVSLGANPPTVSTTNMTGGTDNVQVYDESYGYTFYLDADYSGSASPGDTSNAIDITNFIVTRGLESDIKSQTQVIKDGAISYNRKGFIGYISVDTESSAASDDLATIAPSTSIANGDIIMIYGANSGRVVTIAGGGNLDVAANWSSSTSDNVLWLRYDAGTWREVGRSAGTAVPSYTSFRDEGFPFLDPTKYGATAITAAYNTTKTVTVNSDKNVILITGTVTLTTGDYLVNLSTTGAVAGDMVVIKYGAHVTVGSYKVSINGHDLSAVEALGGGMAFYQFYDGSQWRGLGEWHNLENGYQFETDAYYDGSVTVAKVEDNLKYELIVVNVSFESGELGDYKIKIPFNCNCTEFYARAIKAIAGTDNATITPKNNAGTTMTSGTITFTASDAFGTAYTSTPSANNTFAAGEYMTLTTAKTTAGGKAQISIKLTRV